MQIFDSKPDFINEIGVKWWVDTEVSNYAKNPDSFGTSLDVNCWLVQTPDGVKSRVIACDGEIIYSNQSLEAIGIHINMLKFLSRSE